MKGKAKTDYFKLYIERALAIYGTYKALAEAAGMHPITVRKWHEGLQSPRAGKWAMFKQRVDFDMKRLRRPRFYGGGQ